LKCAARVIPKIRKIKPTEERRDLKKEKSLGVRSTNGGGREHRGCNGSIGSMMLVGVRGLGQNREGKKSKVPGM